jgi:membrane-bound serine protease (ClpP class)
MVTASATSFPKLASPRPARFTLLTLATGVIIATPFFSCPATAQEAGVDGVFITVQSPITSEVKDRVKDVTMRAIQRFKDVDAQRPANEHKVFKIVYDFSPANNGPSNSMDFGACSELAKFILRLQEATSIAFAHGEVTGHTVLPVLACRDIVMSSEAKLGNPLRDQKDALMDSEQQFYRDIIKDRRCPAIVLKMLDPDMVVLRAKKVRDGTKWFIDSRLKDAEFKNGIIVTDPDKPAVDRGPNSTIYTAELAKDLELCQAVLDNRQGVKEAYQLPLSSLREDALLGRNPKAFLIEIKGQLNSAEAYKRRMRRALAQKANILIVQLECTGGDPQAGRELAEFLSKPAAEEGETPSALTIAYIPANSKISDVGLFVALGCTEIIMDKEGTAVGDMASLSAPDQKAARDAILDLAEKQGYPPLLIKGMFDKELTLYQVVSRRGLSEWRIISGEEYEADRGGKNPKWNGDLIKPGGPQGNLLTLNAEEAQRLHLVQHVVDGLPELYKLYGLTSVQVRKAGPDWLDRLSDFLRDPWTGAILVMLGITCLILELKLPGVGLPGVVAAVCFILFFWAHLADSPFWLLAVLLFVLGLILLGLEVFVLPGLGVAGISGTVLVVLSLALVTLEKQPETQEEWVSFGTTMASFGLSMMGAVVAALTVAWYLPSIPYVNRLVLKAPADQAEGDETAADLVSPQLAALLGAIGVTVTPLRPAGKVKFGDEYVDVVTESSYVQPGSRVQVIEIEGNRIVVKEV